MPTAIQTAYSVATLIEAARRTMSGAIIDTEIGDDDFQGTGYDGASATPILGIDGIIAQTINDSP